MRKDRRATKKKGLTDPTQTERDGRIATESEPIERKRRVGKEVGVEIEAKTGAGIVTIEANRRPPRPATD